MQLIPAQKHPACSALHKLSLQYVQYATELSRIIHYVNGLKSMTLSNGKKFQTFEGIMHQSRHLRTLNKLSQDMSFPEGGQNSKMQ